MPFVQRKLDRIFNQSRGIYDKFAYRPDNGDTLSDMAEPGYFADSRFAGEPDWENSLIEIVAADGQATYQVTAGGTLKTPGADNLPMYWAGAWDNDRTYLPGQTAIDGTWAGVANIRTRERLAPQPIGTPTFSLPDTPAFVTQSNVSTIISGNIYTLTREGWARTVRVWVPSVGPSILHQLILVTTSLEGVETLQINNLFNLTANAWNIVQIGNRVFQAGAKIELYLLSIDSSGTLQFQADWNLQAVGTGISPSPGNWTRSASFDQVRVNTADADSGDQTANLQSVTSGTEIKATQVNDTSRVNNFLVNSIQVFTGQVLYNTTGQGSGPGGSVEVGERANLEFVAPAVQTTSYSILSNFWASNAPDWATVQGFLSFDSQQSQVNVPDDNAYGTDLQFQIGDVSDDWDIFSSIIN